MLLWIRDRIQPSTSPKGLNSYTYRSAKAPQLSSVNMTYFFNLCTYYTSRKYYVLFHPHIIYQPHTKVDYEIHTENLLYYRRP